MTREEALVPWLKEQGLYEQFMANMEESWKKYENGVHRFLSNAISPMDIQNAFHWLATPEGFNFWSDISDRWALHYESIIYRQEMDYNQNQGERRIIS